MTQKLDIKNCARCGKNHKGLSFQKLTNPIYCNAFEMLTHWCLCPVLKQPILMGHADPKQHPAVSDTDKKHIERINDNG